jgi:hypothetical protein
MINEQVEAFAAAHTTPLPALLEELVAETEREFGERAGMLSGVLVGTLLQTLIAASGARRVLEIGMFTGFSAQMMAAALPDDGRIITCDVDPKAIAFAKGYFERSPHGHKIEVREGPALDTLRTLEPGFDFVFIDADKGTTSITTRPRWACSRRAASSPWTTCCGAGVRSTPGARRPRNRGVRRACAGGSAGVACPADRARRGDGDPPCAGKMISLRSGLQPDSESKLTERTAGGCIFRRKAVASAG